MVNWERLWLLAFLPPQLLTATASFHFYRHPSIHKNLPKKCHRQTTIKSAEISSWFCSKGIRWLELNTYPPVCMGNFHQHFQNASNPMQQLLFCPAGCQSLVLQHQPTWQLGNLIIKALCYNTNGFYRSRSSNCIGSA